MNDNRKSVLYRVVCSCKTNAEVELMHSGKRIFLKYIFVTPAMIATLALSSWSISAQADPHLMAV